MKSISVYSYLDKLVLVPKQRHKNSLVISQNVFHVIEINENHDIILEAIKKCLDQFQILDTNYDYKLKINKSFNADLAKSVKAKNFKQFWQNSQLINITVKDASYIIEPLKRANDYKGYGGYFSPPKSFNRINDSNFRIAQYIVDTFKQMGQKQSLIE